MKALEFIGIVPQILLYLKLQNLKPTNTISLRPNKNVYSTLRKTNKKSIFMSCKSSTAPSLAGHFAPLVPVLLMMDDEGFKSEGVIKILVESRQEEPRDPASLMCLKVFMVKRTKH